MKEISTKIETPPVDLYLPASSSCHVLCDFEAIFRRFVNYFKDSMVQSCTKTQQFSLLDMKVCSSASSNRVKEWLSLKLVDCWNFIVGSQVLSGRTVNSLSLKSLLLTWNWQNTQKNIRLPAVPKAQ